MVNVVAYRHGLVPVLSIMGKLHSLKQPRQLGGEARGLVEKYLILASRVCGLTPRDKPESRAFSPRLARFAPVDKARTLWSASPPGTATKRGVVTGLVRRVAPIRPGRSTREWP